MGEAKEQNNKQHESKGDWPTRSFDGSTVGPGSQIGHFRIEHELGHGGMGVVYLARDTTLGRSVAIKSLPPEVMADRKISSRLEREARLLASLSHPNIAAIFEELAEAEGATYLILEYVPGRTLADRIAEGLISLEEVLSIASQIAAALATAHGHGIIHRDLKPGNIKITPEGNVKVLDFGLAKAIEEAGTQIQQSTVTQPGRVVGTPAYMSPEQAMGDPVDYRTDIWSLGVVIYEMLTGELPFQGNTQQALTHSILHDEPKLLTSVQRDAPIKLERLISKMLQKDRLSRHGNIKAVAKELETIRRDSVTDVAASRRSPSIAILPFVDMSPARDQEYFCDGMAEELINALSQIKDLRVIARTSAFSYKGKDVNVREIGRELDVATVLEGSVRKAGNRLRITAQLVDATGGHHLWSKRYDREMDDVFAIQDEITSSIVDNLKPKLLGEEKIKLAKERDVDIEAYQLYLMGRFLWNQRMELKTAADYFRLAIKQDPSYALAHDGLADCYNLLGYYNYLRPKEAFPKAKVAALEALKLDNTLAEAYTSLGWISMLFEWDWECAEREFRRAIDLKPNYATAHHWYSVLLFAMGRFDDSIFEIKRAQELDPRSVIINAGLGWPHCFARRYNQAIEAFQNALSIDENFWYAHWGLAVPYIFKGMHKEALAELQKARHLHKGWQTRIESAIGVVYGYMGEREEAQRVLNSLLEHSQHEYVPPVFISHVYFALEDNSQGFDWLDRAFEVRDDELTWIKTYPLYDHVRSDPRYTALLRKMNLEE
jgi:serine/threonine protein kinase/tetratricopeptide (TPR) repeat protein